MLLKKTLQIWGSLIVFLFLFPVILTKVPGEVTQTTKNFVKEPTMMVYAANIAEQELQVNPERKALLYFSHYHEAYEPVTKAVEGKVAVSHQTENIMKFGEKLKNQLSINGIETDLISAQVPHTGAYKKIRPYVEKEINNKNYDLIIDLHRDNLGPSKTTHEYNNEKYAKIAFVIGTEHQEYKKNREMAQSLKNELEKLVPGITRNLILKSGAHVDGKYNQDLHPSLVLIELGGVGNQEDELNRSIAMIAQAAANVLANSTTTEY